MIAALVLTTGLHWAALQTVAWTAMLAANLSTENLSTAVSQTFDGQHLCPLCKAIAAGKKTENKPEASPLKLKLEFPPVPENFALISPQPFEFITAVNFSAKSVFPKPAVPPPRRCFV